MRVLDLFSGIGGFSLGLERAGMTTVAFCEIDPFCRRVLAKHWPGVPILGDIETTEFPSADVVCGGFPCQDLSSAGKRAGLSGSRSGLYRHLVRAIRVVRPRYAIVENVADLLGLGMGIVLGDLAETGYDAEWDCVSAADVGAPHERDRIWIVAHPDGQGKHACPVNAEVGTSPQLGADTTQDRCGARRPWGLADGIAGLPLSPCWDGASPVDYFQARFNQPALLGVDDEVPGRVDRVAGLGNSLVPLIPELIGHVIREAEDAAARAVGLRDARGCR